MGFNGDCSFQGTKGALEMGLLTSINTSKCDQEECLVYINQWLSIPMRSAVNCWSSTLIWQTKIKFITAALLCSHPRGIRPSSFLLSASLACCTSGQTHPCHHQGNSRMKLDKLESETRAGGTFLRLVIDKCTTLSSSAKSYSSHLNK